MNEKPSQLWPLTDLLQWTTRDIEGHAVGRIADIIIDPIEGRIAYLHISMDRAGRRSDLRITIPWSAISRISTKRRDVRIAARKGTLVRLGLRSGAH